MNSYCQLSKEMFMTPRFLLMMFLYPSFGLPVLCDPSLSWEYWICFWQYATSSLFKWQAHLRFHWASISYIPESLDFSRMNLFGIYCHHLTFSISCKWHIISIWSLWAFALYTIPVSASYRRVEKTVVRYNAYLVFMERSL